MSRNTITGKKVVVYLLSGGYQNDKNIISGKVTMQTESDFTLESDDKKKVLIPWTAVQRIEFE